MGHFYLTLWSSSADKAALPALNLIIQITSIFLLPMACFDHTVDQCGSSLSSNMKQSDNSKCKNVACDVVMVKKSRPLCQRRQEPLLEPPETSVFSAMKLDLHWLRKLQNFHTSCLLRKLKPMCIKKCLCDLDLERKRRVTRKHSTSTMHSVDSLEDVRSWCPCESDRRRYFLEQMVGRGRGGLNLSQSAGGDRLSSTSNDDYPDSPRALTLEEMERMFNELQSELVAKDKLIKQLQASNEGTGCGSGVDGEIEHECVTLDTVLDYTNEAGVNNSNQLPDEDKLVSSKPNNQGSSEMDDSMYEIRVASDYTVDGDLLKYIGTSILSQGHHHRGTLQDPGQGRLKETEKQIEVATLGTQIQQLKKLLDEERKKSEDLRQRLKSCEEAKAELRSRSPLVRAPSQNTASSSSVHQAQRKELVRQVEEGREQLNLKQKEIRSLHSRISDLESKLSATTAHDKETTSRLTSTVALLKRCEEHGRNLTASNQEYYKENRRLRGQLDKVNINNVHQSVENYQVSGIDYFDNFLRAKSHKKALAWQKKYLSSVIVGYKSIFRQISHGKEHPELVQMQVPLAPGAAGLLDGRRPITLFRVGALAIIALIRMKYMVNRWHKKRPGESSPDSEYKVSRNSGPGTRIETGVIRPSRNILTHNRINYSSAPVPVENTVNDRNNAQGESVEDISEYINRFESIEHQISSSLSRSRFPS
ncbi:Pericentrin [Orchesella cincta]|uniref:Pericentrin n=1 Tax=Orchesella cincta TaxID=48709 RepID=A0A1D2N717_ORCCI|nr:Pericentrin [Orchesella cincta]